MNRLHKKNIQFVLNELEKENRALLTEDLSTTTTTATEDSAVGVGASVRGVGGVRAGVRGVGGSRGPGEFSGGVGGVRKVGAAGVGGRGTAWVTSEHKEMTETTLLSSIRRDPQSTSSNLADNSILSPLVGDDSSQTDSGGL